MTSRRKAYYTYGEAYQKHRLSLMVTLAAMTVQVEALIKDHGTVLPANTPLRKLVKKAHSLLRVNLPA